MRARATYKEWTFIPRFPDQSLKKLAPSSIFLHILTNTIKNKTPFLTKKWLTQNFPIRTCSNLQIDKTSWWGRVGNGTRREGQCFRSSLCRTREWWLQLVQPLHARKSELLHRWIKRRENLITFTSTPLSSPPIFAYHSVCLKRFGRQGTRSSTNCPLHPPVLLLYYMVP